MFQLKNGHLIVDRANTSFYGDKRNSPAPAESFISAYLSVKKKAPSNWEAFKNQLCDQLDALYAHEEFLDFYKYAFGSSVDIDHPPATTSDDDTKVGHLSLSWTEVDQKIQSWADHRKPPVPHYRYGTKNLSDLILKNLLGSRPNLIPKPIAGSANASSGKGTSPTLGAVFDYSDLSLYLVEQNEPGPHTPGQRYYVVPDPLSSTNYTVLMPDIQQFNPDSSKNPPFVLADNATAQEVAAAIRAAMGGLWVGTEIKRLIDIHYTVEGIYAESTVSDCKHDLTIPGVNASRPNVILLAKPRLRRIYLPSPKAQSNTTATPPTPGNSPTPAPATTTAILKGLYNVLPDAAFREYVNHSENYYVPPANSLPAYIEVKSDLLAAKNPGGKTPIAADENSFVQIDLNKLQYQQLELKQLSLSLNLLASPSVQQPYCDYRITDDSAENAASTTKSPASSTTSSVPGRIASQPPPPSVAVGRTLNGNSPNDLSLAKLNPVPLSTPIPAPKSTPRPGVTPSSKAASSSNANSSPSPSPTPNAKHNYLGVGFEYRPQQGVRVIANSTLQNVAGGNLNLQVGTDESTPIGSGSYSRDYLFFDKGELTRRLTLNVNGSGDTESNRILNNTETDVSRATGGVKVDFEPFRDLHSQYLQLSVDSDYEHITVKNSAAAVPDGSYEMTTLSALYQWTQPAGEWAGRLRIAPKMEIGAALDGSNSNFAVFSVAANFHEDFPNNCQLDVSGLYQRASIGTPVYELPSLGGQNSVRGFRQDEALGDQLWAVQSEFWFPLPDGGGKSSTAEFLVEHIRGAAFFDCGNVTKAVGSNPGFRCAPGLGLRLIYNPVILKLDYAYGFGTKDHGGRDGEVSMTISFTQPL